MLRRIANAVEAVVAVVFVVTVVMLFTNDPTSTSTSTNPAAAVDAYGRPIGTAGPDASEAAAGPDGAAIYARRCATCHGGDGGGGVGPSLVDVAAKYPDVAAQIAVVADGRGQMPSFSRQLTSDEIAAVVEFTRTSLTGA